MIDTNIIKILIKLLFVSLLLVYLIYSIVNIRQLMLLHKSIKTFSGTLIMIGALLQIVFTIICAVFIIVA